MDTLIVRSRNLYTCTSNTFDKNMEQKLSKKKTKKTTFSRYTFMCLKDHNIIIIIICSYDRLLRSYILYTTIISKFVFLKDGYCLKPFNDNLQYTS